MGIAIIIIASALVAVPIMADAQTYTLAGVGRGSCGEWTAERRYTDGTA
jgi:hypothetical protein